MLHTKPQGHWPFGSGEDFWRVFTIYGCGGHLGHVTQTPANKLWFPQTMEAPHEIWLWLTQRFWRKRSLKMVDGRRTDNWACLYYKLTNEPKGSGELIKHCWILVRNFIDLISLISVKFLFLQTHSGNLLTILNCLDLCRKLFDRSERLHNKCKQHFVITFRWFYISYDVIWHKKYVSFASL